MHTAEDSLKKLKKNPACLITSALVADGAVGEVASLGDGDGDLGLDAGALGGVGQHHGAQALGALLPDGAHGASLSAILSGGVAPHSPAPSARHAAAASRRGSTRRPLILVT